MHDPAVVDRAEVNGLAIRSIISAFGAFPILASQYLLAEGIGEPLPDGSVRVSEERFYPMRGWLRVLKKVEHDLGSRVLKQAGEKLMRGVTLPPTVTDIRAAFAMQNVAYHLGHRLDGRLMYDPATKTFTPGIGDFSVTLVPNADVARVRIDTPSSCPLNEGSVLGLARMFQPDSEVVHEPGECRMKGGDACTYRVTWRG